MIIFIFWKNSLIFRYDFEMLKIQDDKIFFCFRDLFEIILFYLAQRVKIIRHLLEIILNLGQNIPCFLRNILLFNLRLRFLFLLWAIFDGEIFRQMTRFLWPAGRLVVGTAFKGNLDSLSIRWLKFDFLAVAEHGHQLLDDLLILFHL